MNKISFLDELMKLGGVRSVVKVANLMEDPPEGMMSNAGVPPAEPHRPDAAASRLPDSVGYGGRIQAGSLGGITTAKNSIDQEKFNRAFRSNS